MADFFDDFGDDQPDFSFADDGQDFEGFGFDGFGGFDDPFSGQDFEGFGFDGFGGFDDPGIGSSGPIGGFDFGSTEPGGFGDPFPNQDEIDRFELGEFSQGLNAVSKILRSAAPLFGSNVNSPAVVRSRTDARRVATGVPGVNAAGSKGDQTSTPPSLKSVFGGAGGSANMILIIAVGLTAMALLRK